jgi:sugar phosphate isomerase/epimerase
MHQPVAVTMLSSMAHADIERAMDRHCQWGLSVLDLKDCLFGRSIETISEDEAGRIREAAERRGLSVHTLSTVLFHEAIEKGERHFRDAYLPQLDRVIANAKILRPFQIRLLAGATERRAGLLDAVAYARAGHAWLFGLYREAIDRIAAAGFRAVIENEVGQCILSRPSEVRAFFSLIDRPQCVRFVWDIQNLWQMGTFPTMEVYELLKPLIGMVHLKGGRAELPGGPLVYRSNLEQASWPVAEIVSAVARDGVSPVMCLNMSHGREHADYRADPSVDLGYVKNLLPRG